MLLHTNLVGVLRTVFSLFLSFFSVTAAAVIFVVNIWQVLTMNCVQIYIQFIDIKYLSLIIIKREKIEGRKLGEEKIVLEVDD